MTNTRTKANNLAVNVVLITPDYAAQLLSRNEMNRKLNEAKVHEFSRSIKNGLWKLNGDAIRVSESGVLLDGQHRLTAVVRTGIPIQSLLVIGLSEDVFDTIDVGKRRSNADILYIAGVKSSNVVSAGIRFYILLLNSVFVNNSMKSPTAQDILSEYNRRPAFWQRVVNNAISYYGRQRLLSSSLFASYYAWFCEYHNENVVEEFFEALTKQNNTQSNAIDLLRNVLIRNLSSNKSLKKTFITAYIIKAFNAYITKTNLKILRYSPEIEEYPKLIKCLL